MAHENWKIKAFLKAYAFSRVTCHERFPMKIALKSIENRVNLPWINSQDFHGFLVHSEGGRFFFSLV